MAGGGAAALREATQAERRAIDDVMRAAVRLKPGGKALSRAMADRLRTTLHAAAGDPELRGALSAGRLVGEAQAGGAWPFALGCQRRELPDRQAEAQAEGGAEARPRTSRPPSARPRSARKALEAELREARSDAEGARAGRVRRGGGRRGGRAATVADARERLQHAKQALEEAEAEAESAERVLVEARASRDEARDTVARLEERLD